MSLVHGKAISAEELERILSREFDARRFASLCNAVAWCSARRRCSTLPSFTERVNVKDKGIDASWDVTLPDDQGYASGLLRPGWNVFQYKHRDISARDRSAIFSGIKTGMMAALKTLYTETKRRPQSYVLFVNLDLIKDQKDELSAAILSGYDQPDAVTVSVVGAGELAAFLVDVPHVRAAYFETVAFSVWEAAVQRHRAEEMFSSATVELVGRDAQLDTLRSLVDSPDVRGIIVSGPSGIGKTRLALAATAHRPLDVVVADSAITPADLRELQTPEVEVVVIVEDPERDNADALVRYALGKTGVKVLITLPTAADAPAPNFGRDERVRILSLAPLTQIESHDLLKKAGATFDYSVESWVVEQAGGIPRILLLAAGLGSELRKTARTFIEDIAEAYERKIRARFGEVVITTLERLSLLAKVGVRRSAATEVKVICQALGGEPNANKVLNTVPLLSEAGLIRVAGSFVEVLPPLLANRLAANALRGRFPELIMLFGQLPERGRARLIERLCQLRSEELTQFWTELFGEHGLFSDLESALTNVHLLHQVAGTIPDRIAPLLYEGLQRLSPAERFAIQYTKRSELRWALEALLFRKQSSLAALRSFALLAEAENEDFGNNATGVFCEVFHASHSQMPLALHSRLKVLRETLSPQNTTSMRLLGVKAAKSGLDNMGGHALRQSRGLEPLDVGPEMTYIEFWEYIEALMDILLEQAQSADPQVSTAARQVVPRALMECALQTPPERCIPRYEKTVGWVLANQVSISVTDLVASLLNTQTAWKEQIQQSEPDWVVRYEACIKQLQSLVERLEQANFSIRLKRWAGDWVYDELTDDELTGDSLSATQEERLEQLAQEVNRDAALLPDDLLEWVCSLEAKRGAQFLFSLGKQDTEKTWCPKMEAIAADPVVAMPFSAYCEGLGKHDVAFVSERLDDLAEHRGVSDDAIVQATRFLGGNPAGIARIERLLQEGRAEPGRVAKSLMARSWIEVITPEECLRLLTAVAGLEWEHGVAVVDFLVFWSQRKRPIEGPLAALAWDCLEHAHNVNHSDEYDFDRLAAHLTETDPERGFWLFETVLSQPYRSDNWMPFSQGIRNTFWEELRKYDKPRAIRAMLTAFQENRPLHFRLTYHVHGALKQEVDQDELIAFASEGKDSTLVVANSISAKYPGFWPIAFAIIAQYPDDDGVLGRLERSIWGAGGIVAGPWSLHIRRCQEEVQRVLNDSSTPSIARSWLRDLQARFAADAERHLVSEYDEEADGFQRGVEGADAVEQQWAIRILARHVSRDQLRQMFSDDVLQAALEQPKIDGEGQTS